MFSSSLVPVPPRCGGSHCGDGGDGDGGSEGGDGVGSSGSGHIRSLVFSLQNSLIFSKRYCRRSTDMPDGEIVSGRSLASGFQLWSFSSQRFSLGELEWRHRWTTPGVFLSKWKWWYLSAVLHGSHPNPSLEVWVLQSGYQLAVAYSQAIRTESPARDLLGF